CARASFINKVIEKVRAYDILVIFDEVMTGFYRTGTFLASDQITHKPDFLCLSKGITGGFLPLAVTLTTDAIYQAFLDHSFNKAFAHGHSYTANPLSCAAARASLDLLMQPKTQSAIKAICAAQEKGMTFLENEVPQLLLKPRTRGTIAAFDLANMASFKEQLKTAFLKQGLLLRPLHNTLYLIPPYVVTTAELESAYHTIADVLKQVVLKKSA
ncbi:MAG: aminotransferase class III-fold pyridoxal phosphate-dependent enzyme, partial [Holosporaceae bacterium]